MGEKTPKRGGDNSLRLSCMFCLLWSLHFVHFADRTYSLFGIARRKAAQEKRLWLALGDGWVWRLLVLLLDATAASTYARAPALHPPWRRRRCRRDPDAQILGSRRMSLSPHHPLQNWMRWHRTSTCLLYTSPSPRDRQKSPMPSSA